MALRALCLFDGYGGFELGLRLAGIDVRTVARVERDSHAAATLVARMGEATLDQAPIWDDVCTFDGRPWRGRVDLITAGFNCQPFSSAGAGRGVDDERWLWPDIARIVADVGPRFVFLENVPGLVRLGGLDRVCGDLADLGFDAEWGLLSAAEVGATIERERFWLLACAQGVDGVHGRRLGELEPERGRRRVGQRGEAMALADDLEPHRQRQQQPRRADARRAGAFPPGRYDWAGWREWVAASGPEPAVRRGTDGRPVGLAESLHLGGNGLVPRVAGAAFLQLAERLGVEVIA